MENNRYYDNRADIKMIANSRGIEVYVACATYAIEQGWNLAESDLELSAFCDKLRAVTDKSRSEGGSYEDVQNFWK